MNRLPASLLWIAASVMEVSYLCAWISFSLDAIAQRRYAWTDAVLVFAAGSALVHWAERQRWSRARILSAHGAALLLFGLRDAGGSGQLGHWVSTMVLWIRAVQTAHRSKTYAEVCARFDVGLSWLFGLLFAKLLTKTAGVRLDEAGSDQLLLTFFLFGLLAIALARNSSGGHKHFMSGYRGIALVTGFSVAVVAAAASLLVILPNLRGASQSGLHALRIVGRPVADAVAHVVLVLFDSTLNIDVPTLPPTSMRPSAPGASRDVAVGPSFVEEHSLALGIAAGFVALAFLAALLWYARHWLFARSPRAAPPGSLLARLLEWLRHALARLGAVWMELKQARREYELIRFYRMLLRWGRRSGLPKHPSETPLEYARRLKRHVGNAGSEIDAIVQAFNLHVYGHMDTSQQSRNLRRALRALRSPRLWPARLRLLLFGEPRQRGKSLNSTEML